MKSTLRIFSGILTIGLLLFSACDSYNVAEENEYSENEPNDVFGSANELVLNETYDAKISPAQELDYYVCNTSGARKITVDGGSGLELYVHAYNEDKAGFYDGDTMARGASITVDIKSVNYSGKFYLMIESAYPGDTGSYTIKVE